MKKYLLSYKLPYFQRLSDDTTFELEIEIVYLWGLFKRRLMTIYTISAHENIEKYTSHWDNLIKNRIPL